MERNFTLQEVREAERAAYLEGRQWAADAGICLWKDPGPCPSCAAEAVERYPDAVPVDPEVALEAAGQLAAFRP